MDEAGLPKRAMHGILTGWMLPPRFLVLDTCFPSICVVVAETY